MVAPSVGNYPDQVLYDSAPPIGGEVLKLLPFGKLCFGIIWITYLKASLYCIDPAINQTWPEPATLITSRVFSLIPLA